MEEFGTPMFQSGTSTLGKINESVLEQTVYNICNDIIALANLKQLVPFLVQHNFLTPSEQDYLSDDRESSSVRIRRQLVPLLVRGGADALATFYACVVAASDGHPGHVTLARKMRFEFYSELSQLERREVFHSSYVERGPCFEPYKHTQDMFDRNHQVILLLGKKLKKHIGDDLRYGKLQQLAMHIGMTYDIGLHIMETYSPHEYYDKVIEYFLNGMCSGEATVMHLILTLVKLKGMGRLLCHVCDLWGFAPSFYSESLARCLSGDWPALARHLGYTEKEIGNIQEVNGQDFQRQSQAFLKMWKIPDCGPHTWDVIYYAFYYANLSHVLDSSLPEITVAKSELYFSLAAAQSVVRLDSRRKTPGIRRAPNAVKLRKNLVPLLPVPKAGKLRKSSLIVFHENIVPSKPDETREGLLPDPFREKDGSASLVTPDVKPFNSVPHNKDSPSIEPLKVNVNSPVTVATTLPEDPENDVIPVQDFQSSDTNDKVVKNVSKGSGSPIFSHYSAHQQPDSEHSTPMFNQGTIAELAMNLFDVAKEDGKMQGSTLSADTTCQLVRLPESEPVAAHHDKRPQMSLPIPCIEGKEIFTNELNSTELVSPISPVERTAEAEVLVEENVNTEAFTPDHLASGFPGSGDYDTGEYSSLDTLQEPSVFPQVEEEMTSVASEQSFRPTSFQRPLRQQSYPEHETDKVFISAVDNLTSNLILRNEVHFPVFIDDMEHHRLFTRSSPPSEQIKTSSSEFLRALSVPTDVDTELVMTLLDSGADLSVKDERGVQPLYYAAIRGLYDVVKAMICKGVDLDNKCTNDCGWTPLGGACFHGKFEVVDLLLEHGANPNKPDFFGRNCLLLASVLKNERILAKFLDCGADINMKANVSNVTPLALACLLGEVDTCKLLLERGANPCGHSPSETGTSPLLAAVYSQNLELVKLLINHNAHVDTVSSSLFTPLHVACLLRNFGIVQILVDHRASVNCKAEDGETPLMCAVTSGAVDIVELLLRRGANPFLDRVLSKELSGVLVSTLGEAALCGHVDVFEVLMEYDADVNYTDKGVVSVLALACVGGSEDIIDYLLKTNEIDLSCGRSMELSVVLATKTRNAKCLDAIVEKVGLENLWRYALERNRASMKNALTPYHCNLVQSLSETPTAKQTEETEGQVHNNPSSSHHVHVSNDLSEPNDPSETSRVDGTTAAGVSVNVAEQSQQLQVPSRFNDLLKDTTSRSEQTSCVEQADEGSGSFQQLGMSLQEQVFDHLAQSYHPGIHIRSAEEGKRLVSLLRFLIIAAGDINDLVSGAIDTGIMPAVEFLTGYFGQKYDEDQSLVQYLQRDGQSQEVLSFIVRKSFSIERLLELSQGLDHHLAHEHFKKLQQHMEEEGKIGLSLLEILGMTGASRLVDITIPSEARPIVRTTQAAVNQRVDKTTSAAVDPTVDRTTPAAGNPTVDGTTPAAVNPTVDGTTPAAVNPTVDGTIPAAVNQHNKVEHVLAHTPKHDQNDFSSAETNGDVQVVTSVKETVTWNSFDCGPGGVNMLEDERVVSNSVKWYQNSFTDDKDKFENGSVKLSPSTSKIPSTRPVTSTSSVIQRVETANEIDKLETSSVPVMLIQNNLSADTTQRVSGGSESLNPSVVTKNSLSLWEAAEHTSKVSPQGNGDGIQTSTEGAVRWNVENSPEAADSNEQSHQLYTSAKDDRVYSGASLHTNAVLRDCGDNTVSSYADGVLSGHDSTGSTSEENTSSEDHNSVPGSEQTPIVVDASQLTSGIEDTPSHIHALDNLPAQKPDVNSLLQASSEEDSHYTQKSEVPSDLFEDGEQLDMLSGVEVQREPFSKVEDQSTSANIKVHTFQPSKTDAQVLQDQPSGTNTQILQSSSSDAQVLQSSSSDAQVLQSSSSDAQVLQSSSSDVQVLQSSCTDAHLLQPSTSDAQVLQSSSSDAQVLQSSSSDAQVFQSSSSDAQVLQPSTSDAQVLQPSSSDAQVLQPSSSDAQVLQPSSSDAEVLQPSSSDAQVLQSSSSDAQVLQSSSSDAQVLQSSSSDAQVLQPSSSGVQYLQSQHTTEPEHLLMNVGGPVQPGSSANVFPCSLPEGNKQLVVKAYYGYPQTHVKNSEETVVVRVCRDCNTKIVTMIINENDSMHKQLLVEISRKVKSSWSILVRRLGVAESAINEVKQTYVSSNERCFRILTKWLRRECDFRPWCSHSHDAKWCELQEALCCSQLCHLVECIFAALIGENTSLENPLKSAKVLDVGNPRLVSFSAEMNSHWRAFSEYMGFLIKEDGCTDADLAHEVIARWIQAKGKAATRENLCRSLTDCNLGFLCKTLQCV